MDWAALRELSTVLGIALSAVGGTALGVLAVRDPDVVLRMVRPTWDHGSQQEARDAARR